MGIFKKILGSRVFQPNKVFKSAQELRKEKEEREKEDQAAFLEISQQRGRRIVEEHRGRSYRNHKPMGRGEAPDMQSFLFGETYSRFSSSNVQAIAYDITRNVLHVQYQNGRWYAYGNFSKQEAQTAWAAPSKGVYLWDAVRIRGTKHGHKKPVTKDSPPPSYLPLDRRYPLESYGSSDVLRRRAQMR